MVQWQQIHRNTYQRRSTNSLSLYDVSAVTESCIQKSTFNQSELVQIRGTAVGYVSFGWTCVTLHSVRNENTKDGIKYFTKQAGGQKKLSPWRWPKGYPKQTGKRTKTMSRLMTKPTNWPERPAKTQISLGSRPVWSESSLSAWRNIGFLAIQWAYSEDWWDRADAQADLSLRCAHRSFCWFCQAYVILVTNHNGSKPTSHTLTTVLFRNPVNPFAILVMFDTSIFNICIYLALLSDFFFHLTVRSNLWICITVNHRLRSIFN